MCPCKDKGWLHASNDGRNEIQRCDSCDVIATDEFATKVHDAMCGCGWVKLDAPIPQQKPFNVSERAKALSQMIGKAIDEELSHPTTGWVAPYVRTAVCDGIAHEFRRVLESVKGCGPCTAKVKDLQVEAFQQRFIG